jgi:hypothetical protein
MADYFLGLSMVDAPVISKLVYFVLPNWQSFWQAEALSNSVQIPWSYVLNCFGYMLFMLGFYSAFACFLFEGRELSSESN